MKNISGKPALIQQKFFLFKAKSLIAFCAANEGQFLKQFNPPN